MNNPMLSYTSIRRLFLVGALSLLSCLSVFSWAAEKTTAVREGERFSTIFKDLPIKDAFEILSRKERINIILSKEVTGNVTINLFDVTVPEAIELIAKAAGYAVDRNKNDYIILDRKDFGLGMPSSGTVIRSFKVQYSDTKLVREILTKHLSRFGKITSMDDRKILVLEDMPEFVERLGGLLREIDIPPKQILIEAQILEIKLDNSQSLGIDWKQILNSSSNDATSTMSKGKLDGGPNSGLFYSLATKNLTLYLSALNTKGRVRALTSPKLLALENQEAVTRIGGSIGYPVTNTVNTATVTTVQFLDYGTTLRVTPNVDYNGKILMTIRPEISTAKLNLTTKAPDKTTTEVTTRLLVEDGQSIFIGGLIQNSTNFSREGIPGLSDIPLIGGLFANNSESTSASETIIIITPRIIRNAIESLPGYERNYLTESTESRYQIESSLEKNFNITTNP